MASPSRLSVLGVVPSAGGLQRALERFRLGGPGAVTALNTDLLRCVSSLAGENEDLEVLPLSDVVKRCLQCCNEIPASTVSRGHFVAALACAAQTLDASSPFLASARFPGFHRATARALQEVRDWNVLAEAMRSAAETMSTETARKLASLGHLSDSADGILSSLGRVSDHEQFNTLFACSSEKPPFPRIFVASGSVDSPHLARLLRWLSENGCEVTVAIDNPLKQQGLFAGASRLAAMLGSEIESLGDPHSLCKALFTGTSAAGGPEVNIISCADPLSEAEWVLRQCLEEMERGSYPEEIAIYVRNLEEYACFLEAGAARLGIKLKVSRRAPVFSNRFARLVNETLEFCASDDPRKLIPLLQCSYLGLTRKSSNEIREAARTAYKAKKNAWPVLTGWAESHQDELPWLHRLLLWREDAVKHSIPLFSWVERLRALIDIVPWHNAAGQGPSRLRDIRAQTALVRSVANVASVRRATEDRLWSLREFASLCPQLWEDEMYVVPSLDAGIAVASSAECIGSVRSVFALGMLEGLFPRRRSEDPILNDEDRSELSKALNLDPPLPTSFDRAKEERDEFYRLCASAQSRLTFSYPQADDARDNVPAFYLEEVRRAAGGRVRIHNYPRIPFAPPAAECRSSADRSLREALDADREEPLPVQFLTRQVRSEMAWPKDQPFTPQDLREVLRCEFRHMVSRRLQLKPSRETSRWFTLRALPQAVRLVQQPNSDVARNALETALEAELDLMYGDAPEWEVAMLRSGGRQMISDWVKREFSSRQLWKKEPESTKVDLPFGAPGIRSEMPGGVPVMGTVAAISRMGPYAVSHLYETQPPKTEGRFGGPLAELDTLYYGIYLLARHGAADASAVEVESMSGDRTLLLLPRMADAPVPARHQDGLRVLDLASGSEGSIAVKGFYDEVKRRLKLAVHQLQIAGIEAMPGEQCTWCGYGELCRRSQEFGEDAKQGLEEDVFEDD